MPETPLVIVGANYLKEEARKVALKTARELVPKLGAKRNKEEIKRIKELFYLTSGLRLIFQQIIDDGIIRNSVDGIFVEFSTPISTLDTTNEDTLDSYTLVWQSKKESSRKENSFRANVENNFGKIVHKLRKTNTTIFNHPDFFLQSKKFEQLISVIDNDTIAKHNEKEREGWNKREIDKDHFGNALKKETELYKKNDYINYITQIKKDVVPKTILHQFKDPLQNKIVYFNGSLLEGIKYHEIIAEETLRSHKEISLYDAQILSHRLFDHFFLESETRSYAQVKDRRTILVSLPIISSKSILSTTLKDRFVETYIDVEKYIKGSSIRYEDLIYQGIGAIFIFLVLKEPSDLLRDNLSVEYNRKQSLVIGKTTEKIVDKLKKLSETLLPILKDYAYGYAIDITKNQRDQAVKYAVQASINQVFARNMSHNIGSHVSYRATNLQVKKRVKEFFLENPKEFNPNNLVFTDWLDYFSEKLDKYEIYRNEYLSDFDSSPKPLKFYENIILPFCENILVLDNIAAGESLNYQAIGKNRLKIKCLIDGEEVNVEYPDLKTMFSDSTKNPTISYPDNFPYLLCSKDFDKLENADEDKRIEGSIATAINKKHISKNDVEVCVHSEQAIYSILENFIRNSAKHGVETEELVVCLDLRKEADGKYFNLYIYDNRSKVDPIVLFNDDEKKPGIHQKITQSFLDKLGKPRKANWGFADMKINSFLLFNDFESIEDRKLSSNLKLVINKEEANELPEFEEVNENLIKDLSENKEYAFGFKIKISVPKKILWIGKFESEKKAEFENEGLEFVESLEKLSETAGKWEGLKSFQFAVINGKFDYDYYIDIQEKLPGRVIVLNNDKTREVKPSILLHDSTIPPEDSQTASGMLNWCWRKWLTRKGNKIDLYLYFENEIAANEWYNAEIKLGRGLNLEIVNKLNNRSLINDKTTNILYDHHGNAFKGKNNRKYLDVASAINMNFATQHSLVCFGGGSEDFSSLNYPPDDMEDKKQLLFQRIDAATTNIFIIDERIADFALNGITNRFQPRGYDIGSEEIQKSNWNMYAAGKVFIIHEIKNGDCLCEIGKEKADDGKLMLDISNGEMNLVTDIFNLEDINNDVCKDILIIHRTYLNEDRINVDPVTFLRKAKEIFGSVFITSGGGYPHNLNINCRFLSFSALESCINSHLAKNKLNNILRTNIR